MVEIGAANNLVGIEKYREI